MAIVAGGITGIIAVYLLSKAGKSVVLVDKGRIAMSETGHTTAHIVETTDADYREIIKTHARFGVTKFSHRWSGQINERSDSGSLKCGRDLVDLEQEARKDAQIVGSFAGIEMQTGIKRNRI